MRLSIALALPVGELAERISADDLREYEAYYSLEPWGSQADDIRCAIISHTIAACLGSGKAKFADFIPKWDQSAEVLDRKSVRAWAATQR